MKRFVLWALAGVGFLILLVVVIENWRGKRAWNKFRAEWEAKGEQFELAAVIPKPVPDDQNFAMTPFLAPLLDLNYVQGQARWNDPDGKNLALALGNVFKTTPEKKTPAAGRWETGTFVDLREWQEYFDGNANFPFANPPQDAARDVLTALKKFDSELDELRLASARPYSVFPVHYEKNVNALLPHLAVLKGVAQIVRLRALARLGAGQTNEALDDVKFSLRLADALADEPLLISQLVRIAMLNLALQPVWEGLARHQWTDAQLAGIQAEISRIHVLADFGRAMRGERNLANGLLDDLRTGKLKQETGSLFGDGAPSSSTMRFLPTGWFYHNQVSINRLYLERSIPIVDAGQHRVFPELSRLAESAPELKQRHIYNVFAALLYPAVAKSAMRFAQSQTSLDLATVACALERYRIAESRYPEKLDPLVPRFIATLPTDVINGKPLNYFRTEGDQFVLYSVGWNERDEGGEVMRLGRGGVDPKEGDWVWQYPDR